MPVTLFFCYTRNDKPWLYRLKAYLHPFQREGLVELWDDGDMTARTEWEQEISKHLNAAQIILLLVSPDFMACKCGSGVQIQASGRKARTQRGLCYSDYSRSCVLASRPPEQASGFAN